MNKEDSMQLIRNSTPGDIWLSDYELFKVTLWRAMLPIRERLAQKCKFNGPMRVEDSLILIIESRGQAPAFFVMAFEDNDFPGEGFISMTFAGEDEEDYIRTSAIRCQLPVTEEVIQETFYTSYNALKRSVELPDIDWPTADE